MSVWGVYSVQGRMADGSHTASNNRAAKAWFVRWRVGGTARRRTFRQKGHAQTFHGELMEAKRYAWAADERGWPVDPGRPVAGSAAMVRPTADTLDAASESGHSFESYVWDVWWPTLTQTLEDKNRLGHRRNAEVAVELVRYPPVDPRLGSTHNAGDSIALHHLVADDLKSAVVRRRSVNGRTAAVNQRRLTAALLVSSTARWWP